MIERRSKTDRRKPGDRRSGKDQRQNDSGTEWDGEERRGGELVNWMIR